MDQIIFFLFTFQAILSTSTNHSCCPFLTEKTPKFLYISVTSWWNCNSSTKQNNFCLEYCSLEMDQVWTGYWGMTTASSWLFLYNPHRSRVGSSHHPHPPRVMDGLQALPMDCLVALLHWHPPQQGKSPKNFPISTPTSLCLDGGQNTSILEERKESKVFRAAQLAPLPLLLFVYGDLSGLTGV